MDTQFSNRVREGEAERERKQPQKTPESPMTLRSQDCIYPFETEASMYINKHYNWYINMHNQLCAGEGFKLIFLARNKLIAARFDIFLAPDQRALL